MKPTRFLLTVDQRTIVLVVLGFQPVKVYPGSDFNVRKILCRGSQRVTVKSLVF